MAKTIFYKQCKLQRQVDEKTTWHHVAWIPEKFAHKNHVIKIRNGGGKAKDSRDEAEGEWVDGWVVKSVGSTRLSEDQLPDSHDGIKNHRRRTGDAEKKRKDRKDRK